MFITSTAPVRMGKNLQFGQQTFEAKYVSAANTILDAVGKEAVTDELLSNTAVDRKLELSTLQAAVLAEQTRRQNNRTSALGYKPTVSA